MWVRAKSENLGPTVLLTYWLSLKVTLGASIETTVTVLRGPVDLIRGFNEPNPRFGLFIRNL